MKSAKTEKRKHEEESRVFNLKWKKEHAFTVQNNKPLCLICNELLGENKCSSAKRHNEINHKNFLYNFPPKSEVRKNKLAELKFSLTNQQKFIKVFNKESDIATEPSFVISWNIACSKHLYSDCELVKKKITEVFSVSDLNNKNFSD